jgi:hypothetical protein
VIRRQVLDDSEGHSRVSRHMLEELFERLKAARGGANGHDQELVCITLTHLFRLQKPMPAFTAVGVIKAIISPLEDVVWNKKSSRSFQNLCNKARIPAS